MVGVRRQGQNLANNEVDTYVVTYQVPDIKSKLLVPCGIPGIFLFLGYYWLGWVQIFTSWIRGDESILYFILFRIVAAVVRFAHVFGRHLPESLSYSSMNVLMATFSAATAYDLQRHYF